MLRYYTRLGGISEWFIQHLKHDRLLRPSPARARPIDTAGDQLAFFSNLSIPDSKYLVCSLDDGDESVLS